MYKYYDLELTGSAYKHPKLKRAKIELGKAKGSKLEEKHLQYDGVTSTFLQCLEHLREEVEEVFQYAGQGKNPSGLMRELADVSNMVDILTLIVLTMPEGEEQSEHVELG